MVKSLYFSFVKRDPTLSSFLLCIPFQVSVPQVKWKLWEISRTAGRNRPHFCKFTTKSHTVLAQKRLRYLFKTWQVLHLKRRSVSFSGWSQHCVSLWSAHSFSSWLHRHCEKTLCGETHGLCSDSHETELWRYTPGAWWYSFASTR